tara:strand:+ start:388 stop:528 length:141 start_codon:yes stop_codon:yes gene_type:complete
MSQKELINNKENQKNQFPNQNSFLKIDELKCHAPMGKQKLLIDEEI